LVADAEWSCLAAGERPREPLTIVARDIQQAGLDVRVEQQSRPDVVARARFRQRLERIALCKGLSIGHFAGDLQIESVLVYLDPADVDAAPAATPCPE
jgi:hypothetical protein